MKLRRGGYLYGRVISADRPTDRAPMPGSTLIHVFDLIADDPSPEVELMPMNLLVSPLFINRLPWSLGLFKSIAMKPVESGDRLSQYCFKHWSGGFVDEDGRRVADPVEPCGVWGLSSYAGLDRLLGEALSATASRDIRRH